MISFYSYTFIIRLFFVYLDGGHFAIHTKLYDLGPNIQSTIVMYNTDCHHNNKLFPLFYNRINTVFPDRKLFFYKIIYLVVYVDSRRQSIITSYS